MVNYIVLFIIVGIFWYWWTSVSAYEVAYKEAKQACKRLELQFLDDSVDVFKLRLCRHNKGYMQICRIYEFEFTQNGNSRYKGYVYMSGKHYDRIEMDAYTIDSKSNDSNSGEANKIE